MATLKGGLFFYFLQVAHKQTSCNADALIYVSQHTHQGKIFIASFIGIACANQSSLSTNCVWLVIILHMQIVWMTGLDLFQPWGLVPSLATHTSSYNVAILLSCVEEYTGVNIVLMQKLDMVMRVAFCVVSDASRARTTSVYLRIYVTILLCRWLLQRQRKFLKTKL